MWWSMAKPDSKTAVNVYVDNDVLQRFDQARMRLGQSRTTAVARAMELYACFLDGQEIRPDFAFTAIGVGRGSSDRPEGDLDV